MMSTMRKHFGPILFSLCLGAVLCCTSGRADTITFETLPDENFFAGGGQNIAGFYPGLTFGPYVTGLSVSRFGGYSDAAFPPHSGDVVVWSAFDPNIDVAFATPQALVGFWFTSLDLITLSAYYGGSNLLGSVIGYPNTDGFTGTSSYLEFTGTGIASVSITGAASQYVVDDLTFGTTTVVPEPGSLFLLGTAVTAVALLRFRRPR